MLEELQYFVRLISKCKKNYRTTISIEKTKLMRTRKTKKMFEYYSK